MKKVKSMKGWNICKLNKREIAEYGFEYAVIHPDNAEYMGVGILTPDDTDIECETLDAAVSWVEHYDDPVEDETPAEEPAHTTTAHEAEKEPETMTAAYSYLTATTENVVDFIRDEIDATEYTDRDALAEYLDEELWTADGVTGNASGSYTFSRARAREYVLADFETVAEALREFCVEADEIGRRFLAEDWEWLDVTARCYVLGQAIEAALDQLAEELTFAEADED